jgi:hypothetical protein
MCLIPCPHELLRYFLYYVAFKWNNFIQRGGERSWLPAMCGWVMAKCQAASSLSARLPLIPFPSSPPNLRNKSFISTIVKKLKKRKGKETHIWEYSGTRRWWEEMRWIVMQQDTLPEWARAGCLGVYRERVCRGFSEEGECCEHWGGLILQEHFKDGVETEPLLVPVT